MGCEAIGQLGPQDGGIAGDGEEEEGAEEGTAERSRGERKGMACCCHGGR